MIFLWNVSVRANLFNDFAAHRCKIEQIPLCHQSIDSLHLTHICMTLNLSYIDSMHIVTSRLTQLCIINRQASSWACRDNQMTCLGTISVYETGHAISNLKRVHAIPSCELINYNLGLILLLSIYGWCALKPRKSRCIRIAVIWYVSKHASRYS